MDFYHLYRDVFDIRHADNQQLKEQVFRLRYQVYCVENPYENPADFPDGLERDTYDNHADHSLLIYRPTGLVLGAVRVVLPLQDDPLHSFPLQKICPHPMLHDADKLVTMTELSRFCISKAARGQLPPSHALTELMGTAEQSRATQMKLASMMSLGLVTAVIDMVISNGKQGTFAMMEPSLLRLLARQGIHFNNLGEPIDYRGLRQPCYIDGKIFADTRAHDKDVWAIVSDNGRLEKKLKAAQLANGANA